MITSSVKCGMKLLIHVQTSMLQPLQFGNDKKFIPHFTGYVITYPCWNLR